MSLKNQIINYFLLNKDAGVNLMFLDEKINYTKKYSNKIQPAPNIIVENKIEENIKSAEKNNKANNKQTEKIVNELKSTDNKIINVVSQLYQFEGISDLISLNKHIANCQNCILGTTRTNLVFGEGNPNADIMVIGEAPGADEDEQGFPFVGKAGKLLTDILKAVNLPRSDVYIANICKCRPPGNRKPLADEIERCEKYLHKQIELIKPQFILALGLTAAEALFKKTYKMGDIRGKLFEYRGIKTLITYHPAALLRNPNWKRPVWEDIKLLRGMYDNYLMEKGCTI